MIEGVEKGHSGPGKGGKGERRATPGRAGIKGKNKEERGGRHCSAQRLAEG